MQNIILGFLTSLLIVVFGIPSIITVAKLKGLFDDPNSRKLHTRKIPRLGGVAIIAGFAIAASLWGIIDSSTGKLQYIQAALIILFFSGLKDDIIVISPVKKLLSQIMAAAIVIFGDNIRISGLYGFMGVHEIPYIISVALTLFTIIVITNAFNLIDGVDGLAGGIGFIAAITFGLWFIFIDEMGWAILSFALSGALLGFLIFNFNPAKIFMGDSGSLTTGFLLSIMAIKFIEFNSSASSTTYKIQTAPAIAIAILIIPLFDTLRVFVIRMLKKQSPFAADKNHLHHSLIKIGLGHREVCYTLYLANISFVLIALLLKDTSTTNLILIIAALATIIAQIPTYIFRHRVMDIDAEKQIAIMNEFAEQLNKNVELKEKSKS